MRRKGGSSVGGRGYPLTDIVPRYHSLYNLWISIRERCYNPQVKGYEYYGGRGIQMDEEWRTSCAAFVIDIETSIGPRPSLHHSIDRYPNNDGHYEPGNVRWATAKEQNANQRPRRTWRGRPTWKTYKEDQSRRLDS